MNYTGIIVTNRKYDEFKKIDHEFAINSTTGFLELDKKRIIFETPMTTVNYKQSDRLISICAERKELASFFDIIRETIPNGKYINSNLYMNFIHGELDEYTVDRMIRIKKVKLGFEIAYHKFSLLPYLSLVWIVSS